MGLMWSITLAAVGVLGLYVAGIGKWQGWALGLFAQTLWVAYAVATEQWGFIASALAYGYVYGKNTIGWYRKRVQTPEGLKPPV